MKKSYIILAIILVSFMIIMYLIFGFNSKKETYIVIGNDVKWKLTDKWEDDNTSVQFPTSTKFNVYDETGYLGNYIIKHHNDKWYVFDESDNFIKTSGDIFATNDSEIVLENYEVTELNNDDLKQLDEILKEYDILDYTLLSINKKIEFDFNQDGENEELFIVSNLFSEENNGEDLFSLIYYVNNNKVQIIKENIVSKENELDSQYSDVGYILNVDRNKKYELIIKNECFNNVCEPCYEMYKLKFGKYKSIKSCE